MATGNQPKKTRAKPPVGYEENDRFRSTEELQQQVLEQIRSTAPEVLRELFQYLAPYSLLPMEYMHLDPVTTAPLVWEHGELFRDWTWTQLKRAAQAGDPTAAQLQQDLSTWAMKWLKDEPAWFMTKALRTLDHWNRHGADPSSLAWAPPDDFTFFHSPLLEEPPAFRFQHPGWRFLTPTRQQWIEEVTAAFTAARDQYLEYIDWNIESQKGSGVIARQEKRGNSFWHVEAFVRYQVLSKSKKILVDELCQEQELVVCVQENTIDKAIRNIAESAVINLRSESIGRPRGSRNVVRR